MKIDRLLSIVVYLLNRELASASALAERFGVSVRTIQRDMDAINLAGIPVMSVQGPSGGYGIMDGFKLDRRLVSPEDLFYIITALNGIAGTLDDGHIAGALETVRGLLPSHGDEGLRRREERLHVDFSALGGGPAQRDAFRVVQAAVEEGRLLEFEYTSNRLESTRRVVEPMTVVFKWRAWYLFGYCRLRGDYRLFRASRIRGPVMLSERFARRPKAFEEFERDYDPARTGKLVEMRLRFSPEMAPLVEEYHNEEDLERRDDGSIVVRTAMPEDGWMYGYVLSYGHFVEVLEPERLRAVIKDAAGRIRSLYE
ncbi:MAG TPA: YafY family protein [Spirochaetia bacterium]|nr:YafY family protein [Spirochaetales bacterium]HRW24882.1 YafY family protein [Spirochaetia bacterium]